MGFESIESTDFKERIHSGEDCHILDVRSPAEFLGRHLLGAVNVPMSSLSADVVRSKFGSTDKKIYVVCHSGGRSRKACEQLASQGLNVINVVGGTSACLSLGMPAEKSSGGAISIERQVRIAAGTLVLIGFFLGFFVHPYGYILSALVGAGLAFAGITDTCAMGLLLAMMPWNQVSDSCKPQSN